METNNSVPSRRGRPPKIARSNADTRALLINTGLAVLTEKGFSATGIDLILKSAQVPKGSGGGWLERYVLRCLLSI